MATAKKLPSGSWRCQAYSHSILLFDKSGRPILDQNGKQKKKRIYESFTSDDPTKKGKRESELAAAAFQADKSKKVPTTAKKAARNANLTLREGISEYIASRTAIRSPTTIQGYQRIQNNAFPDFMDMSISDFDDDLLVDMLNSEAQRPSNVHKNHPQPISAKTLHNEWGLITAVLKKRRKDLDFDIELPEVPNRVPELLPAETVFRIVKGTEIELAVLLAAWLSFSMSEVRGLTKSKSIRGDYITIAEVVVDVDGQPIRKELGKNAVRNRRHRIPPYIKELIDQVEGDTLVPFTSPALYCRWKALLQVNDLPHMTFHDLRHLNASVMALLRVPDKYAQERGGWSSDKVMKKVYTQTFPEERVKVDDTVDEYFNSIVSGATKKEPSQTDEIMALLNANNPNGLYEAFIDFLKVQHEMQHEKKKA